MASPRVHLFYLVLVIVPRGVELLLGTVGLGLGVDEGSLRCLPLQSTLPMPDAGEGSIWPPQVD